MSKAKTKNLMTYDERHRQMLDAAKKLVKGDDFTGVSAAAVSRTCKCTGGLVFAHFANRDVLRDAVRQYVKTGQYPKPRDGAPAPKKVIIAPKRPVVKPTLSAAQVKRIKEKEAAKKVTAPKGKPVVVAKGATKPKVSAKAVASAVSAGSKVKNSKAATAPAAAKKTKPVTVKPVVSTGSAGKLAVPPAPSTAE